MVWKVASGPGPKLKSPSGKLALFRNLAGSLLSVQEENSQLTDKMPHSLAKTMSQAYRLMPSKLIVPEMLGLYQSGRFPGVKKERKRQG